MKEGIFSRVCASPDSRPASGADGHREHEGASSRAGATVSATTTLASEAMDWIERSIPPSMITKVTPVARMKSTAVSLASCKSVAGCRKTGCTTPTSATRIDERGERQPLAQAVGAEAVDESPPSPRPCAR